MDLKELLENAIIKDISYIRGYGIVPARFSIEIESLKNKYYLEIEINFRIIKNKKIILCFDDVF